MNAPKPKPMPVRTDTAPPVQGNELPSPPNPVDPGSLPVHNNPFSSEPPTEPERST
jgi:hypothetical protein